MALPLDEATLNADSVDALPPPVRDAALRVWEFMQLRHELRRSDAILALGSNDIRVAERAAQLWLDGWAPLLVLSGGVGRMTEGLYGDDVSEGEAFARVAERMGVPRSAMLVEGRSTNTGENVVFARRALEERAAALGVAAPRSYIVVQKPFMEQRALATFRRHIPDADVAVVVTSPQVPLQSYPAPPVLPLRLVLNAMAGDLQRCRLYGRPPRNFQAPVAVPGDVWAALRLLAAAGFSEQLVVDDAASKLEGRTVYEGLEEDEDGEDRDAGDGAEAVA